MNIGIFTDTYYPEVNGVANSAYELKKGLENRGHRVYIFTVTNPQVKRNSENNVFRIPSVPFIFMRERRLGYPVFRLVKRRIKKLGLDVIHTQTEFSMGHLGRKMAEYLNIPHIHTYHTIYEDYTHYLKLPGNTGFKSVIRHFSRHCCENADAVIVPTEKVEKLLRTYRVDKRIEVIPSGINLKKFTLPDENKVQQLKKQYAIADKRVLIYIGRISQEKNIAQIIDYFARLAKTDEKAVLMIVGDGPEMSALKKQSGYYGLDDRIIFTGMVAWNEIENYYALGDIFVSASTSETQGLTYAEALASGLPLLVRADDCLNNILTTGVNGVGFKDYDGFADGFALLIQNKDSAEYKEKIRSSILSLAGDEFAKKVEKAYIGILH